MIQLILVYLIPILLALLEQKNSTRFKKKCELSMEEAPIIILFGVEASEEVVLEFGLSNKMNGDYRLSSRTMNHLKILHIPRKS